ncbi:UNKNOWN [Stylonychia lemnae]|uniref:Uncharacterized protein n=1 Tax=Stylonychia lemnae TaxID=5949 RepID=A0A078B2U8_STYLE|nr:UNKNOWN [Stylonychia lemnae]|eukprot:CDW87833.1 UNKNOWN [Stylonychia lemnae]
MIQLNQGKELVKYQSGEQVDIIKSQAEEIKSLKLKFSQIEDDKKKNKNEDKKIYEHLQKLDEKLKTQITKNKVLNEKNIQLYKTLQEIQVDGYIKKVQDQLQQAQSDYNEQKFKLAKYKMNLSEKNEFIKRLQNQLEEKINSKDKQLEIISKQKSNLEISYTKLQKQYQSIFTQLQRYIDLSDQGQMISQKSTTGQESIRTEQQKLQINTQQLLQQNMVSANNQRIRVGSMRVNQVDLKSNSPATTYTSKNSHLQHRKLKIDNKFKNKSMERQELFNIAESLIQKPSNLNDSLGSISRQSAERIIARNKNNKAQLSQLPSIFSKDNENTILDESNIKIQGLRQKSYKVIQDMKNMKNSHIHSQSVLIHEGKGLNDSLFDCDEDSRSKQSMINISNFNMKELESNTEHTPKQPKQSPPNIKIQRLKDNQYGSTELLNDIDVQIRSNSGLQNIQQQTQNQIQSQSISKFRTQIPKKSSIDSQIHIEQQDQIIQNTIFHRKRNSTQNDLIIQEEEIYQESNSFSDQILYS